MKKRVLTSIALLTVVGALFAPAASAHDGYGFGLGLGFSQGYFQGYQGVNQRRIPYFALHPPVYYGQKVARPYGFSPFATPPAMVPAEMNYVPKVEVREIENPFYVPQPNAPGEPLPEPTGRETARRQPLRDKTT